jgi:ferredoxin
MDITSKLTDKNMEVFGLCNKELACTTCSVHILNKYEFL